MNLPLILEALASVGIRLARTGDKLHLRGPVKRLPAELLAATAAHKGELLALLDGEEALPLDLLRTARLNDATDDVNPRLFAESDPPQQKQHNNKLSAALLPVLNGKAVAPRSQLLDAPSFRRWRGEVLDPAEGALAFDTETELIPDDPAAPPPRLALATACAGGKGGYLIHPDDLGAFVLAHRDLEWVCHNVAFDYWVAERHLRGGGEEAARQAWAAVASHNRLHDTMILDGLVRLARNDSFPRPRALDAVAAEYGGVVVDKNGPYRQRFGEIIGRDWSQVDPGFFAYAARDAVATLAAYHALRRQAQELAARHAAPDVIPDARQRFGLLSEAVQVKKAIALAAVRRLGMAVDLDRVRAGEADLRRRINTAVAAAREHCPDLFQTYKKTGAFRLTPNGVPRKNAKALAARLALAKAELEAANPATLDVPLTDKEKRPTTSAGFWADYAELHPFVRAWLEADELAKLLQFEVAAVLHEAANAARPPALHHDGAQRPHLLR